MDQRIINDIYYTLIKQLVNRNTAPEKPDLKVLESTSKMTGKTRSYIYCPSCDLLLNESDTFCRYCGQRIHDEATYRLVNDVPSDDNVL